MHTLIRRCVLRRLIWVCTVGQCPSPGFRNNLHCTLMSHDKNSAAINNRYLDFVWFHWSMIITWTITLRKFCMYTMARFKQLTPPKSEANAYPLEILCLFVLCKLNQMFRTLKHKWLAHFKQFPHFHDFMRNNTLSGQVNSDRSSSVVFSLCGLVSARFGFFYGVVFFCLLSYRWFKWILSSIVITLLGNRKLIDLLSLLSAMVC